MAQTATLQYGRVASQASVDERVGFIRKVYLTFFFGVIIYALGGYLGVTNDELRAFTFKIIQLHWLLYLGLIIGLVFAVQALSTIPKINYLAFAGFTFLFGLLCTPLLLYAMQATGGTEVIEQAAILTVSVFGALTFYAFTTKRDFTIYRSILTTALILVVVLSVVGIFMGFAGNAWMSIIWIILMAGYVIYDTQMIMKKYPTNMHVAAAISLFIDFIIMFQRILMLLSRRR